MCVPLQQIGDLFRVNSCWVGYSSSMTEMDTVGCEDERMDGFRPITPSLFLLIDLSILLYFMTLI